MSGAGHRPFRELAEPVLRDDERRARVEQIKEAVMFEQERQWCIVPNCDDEVIVEQEVVLRVTNTSDSVPVMVPFCRGHGPEAGGSV